MAEWQLRRSRPISGYIRYFLVILPTTVFKQKLCMGGRKERWSDSETGQPAQLLALLRLRTLIVKSPLQRDLPIIPVVNTHGYRCGTELLVSFDIEVASTVFTCHVNKEDAPATTKLVERPGSPP